MFIRMPIAPLPPINSLVSESTEQALAANQGKQLKTLIDTKTQQATQAIVGVSRAASQAEVNTGTVTTEYVAPATAKAAPWAIKAYALFDSDGTLIKSFNVSSVTKNGTGDYTINFANALDALPVLGGTVKPNTGTSTIVLGMALDGVLTTSAIQVNTHVNTATPTLVNPLRVSALVF
jgi:hypothetical protein